MDRRQILVGGAGLAGLSMFGLLGCTRHGAKDPWLTGRSSGPFRDWSLITPRDELYESSKFDVVVIGSGYGGAVAATRLAGAGAKVAILERGQEWLPGDFPETMAALTGAERAGDRMGLIDLHAPLESDLDIVSASGVGGTSLINAAISSRPLPSVFEAPEWPDAIRAAHADGSLARYFDTAEAILKPNRFAGADPRKVALHRSLARERGGKGAFDLLPVNITYTDQRRGDPKWPVEQKACVLCGNCTTGCNYGAKSTLQANYLPMARARGARIFAGVDVDRIEKRRGHWRVHYTALGRHGTLVKSIDADRVVLAAGALGSSEIMLRSRAAGLALSDTLGTRVSANGDLLGIAYNGNQPTGLVGRSRDRTGVVGTALMGYVDYRGERALGARLEDQFLLIEGTIPVGAAAVTARALVAWALMHPGDITAEQQKRIDRDTNHPDGWAPDGALAHSTLYLACGHDDSGGRYSYQPRGRPRVIWPGVGQSRFVSTIWSEMKAYTEMQGGTFIPNPRTTLFGGRIMVPHPLGGCPMANDARAGVVDHVGRVFDGKGNLHAGLHVLDGSIIPRSLAATPLLAICALTERATESMTKAG
jgi:cholesterol oxidase